MRIVSFLLLFAATAFAQPESQWPAVTRTMRPWAYNWWMGSAVDETNLLAELNAFREAGMGGIHIIPIYQAVGGESNSIPFLSGRWMEMLTFAVEQGNALDLGVDMTTGTGWCFGGPAIKREEGVEELRLGKSEKDLRRGGTLLWKGPDTVLFTRFTGLNVKRASPGGTGLMLNPIYRKAMLKHLAPFTAAFDRPGAVKPRAMYHDSFEYYGTGWSPDFFALFKKYRGYELRDHLAELAGIGDADTVARVKCDYRETVSDGIVREAFPEWARWCKERGLLTRNEAHGACANVLDFYAVADIPETEMFGRGNRDPLNSCFDERFREGDRPILHTKLASSAAHLKGTRLVSSETCTWMAEHFCGTLEEMKCFVDLLFLSGVNHIFYHGCNYSPADVPWPGWCFYASTEVNPRNPVWHDLPVLNAYFTRCQSIFQTSAADNDVLLYWPIHDLWSEQPGFAQMLAVHNFRDWFLSKPVGRVAEALQSGGYSFDYVSDALLQAVTTNSPYRSVIVPPCKHLPPATARRLAELADAGMKICFVDALPQDVPGLKDLAGRRESLKAILGKGKFIVGSLGQTLPALSARRESWAAGSPLNYVRLRRNGRPVYFIVNASVKPFDGSVELSAPLSRAMVMNPMDGAVKPIGASGRNAVPLSLNPGESVFIQTSDGPYSIMETAKETPAVPPLVIPGPWKLTFLEGGPALPAPYAMDRPGTWSLRDGKEEPFSGTVRYSTAFDVPAEKLAASAMLDLGAVHYSARVRLNGRDLGALIMPPYRLKVPPGVLLVRGNVLEVEVTSTGANRIRDLDKRHVPWKQYHDTQFVNISYKPFDASSWPLKEYGLLGPVTIR
jgi:hypothetical protein